MKKQSLEQILDKRLSEEYPVQYEYILGLINDNKIKPVKSSKSNGKKPALHTYYWIIEEEKDYSELTEELRFHIDPAISIDYYLSHPDIYEAERDEVRKLSDYLRNSRDRLNIRISFNERSFEIWGREKFLSGGATGQEPGKESTGKKVLKHCGLDEAFLNCYATAEPFAYYAHSRHTPQNILILENKDPFFSMRRYLLDGNTAILGERVGTLIYGAGKRVISSFQEFDISAEPYMKEPENQVLYFGDLDYEGIIIYEKLASVFQVDKYEIKPFVPAYIAMLDKGADMEKLPFTKENQNRNIGEMFFGFFDSNTVDRIKSILENGRYIPQEILNISDFYAGAE